MKSQGSHLALALSSALWGIQFVEMRRLVSNWKKNMGKHRDEVVVFLLEMSVFCFFFFAGERDFEGDVFLHENYVKKPSSLEC